LVKLTNSMCPECYRIVPAAIVEKNGVIWMDKNCPEHGRYGAMVERDAFWYHVCNNLNCNNIYDGYIIDVTGKCNIKCKYCYTHGGIKNDIPKKDIIADAEAHKNIAPFILMGGEPTLHNDLPEIYKSLSDMAPTSIITNGIKMCDEAYLDELCENGLVSDKGILKIGLSFHAEANGKDIELLELCRKKRLRVMTTLYVIDDITQINEA